MYQLVQLRSCDDKIIPTAVRSMHIVLPCQDNDHLRSDLVRLEKAATERIGHLQRHKVRERLVEWCTHMHTLYM